MPWKKSGGGFTTPKGGFVKNPAQYEKLKQKGFDKSSAAAITNADGAPPPKKGKK